MYEKEGIDYFEKKKIMLLTKEELKSYQDPKVCYICWKKIYYTICYLLYHFYYTGKYSVGSHIICNLKFNVLKEIQVVFRNGSNYDYHFFYKRISKRVWEKIWMSLVKYRNVQNFFVPIEKEVRKIDKNVNKSVVTLSYMVKYINSARFMKNSLSNKNW